MEIHLKNRPKKEIYSLALQKKLREEVIEKVKSKFLPNNKIIKIILIGSLIKGGFGKYEPPGFRNSLYSDFDFIFIVEEDYRIPKWLNKEPTSKPFSKNSLNLAYRNKKFIADKYDVEIFFIYLSTSTNLKVQEEGELAGIPMKKNTKIKHLTIYEK